MKLPRWGEANWKPIPTVIYERVKHGFLGRHIWVHYVLHCSFCVLVSGMRGNYKWFTPSEWRASEKVVFTSG